MAWRSLQHDIALDWGATSLLQASVDVILAFLVLICALINFVTSSFIRVSGLYIPCPSCAQPQKEPLTSTDKASQSSFVVNNPSLTILSSSSAFPLREIESSNIDHCDSSLKESELRISAELTSVGALIEDSPGEPLRMSMEDSPQSRDGAAGEDRSASQNNQATEISKNREQEAIDREQEFKDRELMEALQAERENLAALYSELEQERNSSATAASEALAMIYRLQEEKAAVQMEARQFQRMVMEKAMYDQEAIEVLKEILAKREEEKIALEEEILECRERLDSMLMEESHQAERVGSQMPMIEGTAAEWGASQKSEPAIPIKSERIGASARAVNEEQSKYLDRLNKTKSQLLTALLQEGVSEPATIYMEESVSFADEIHKAKAKIPLKAGVAPVLDVESEKDSLGLGSIKTGRENGLQNAPGSAKRQTGKIVAKNDGKADETEFVSLKRRWSSRGSQEVSQETLNKAKEDRRIEEKRLSVLEYVWKFEEQLQQQGGRPPLQVARQQNSGEPRSKSQSPVERSSSPGNADATLPGLTRDESLRRRLFADGDPTEQDLSTTSFLEGEDGRRYEQQVSFTDEDDGKVDDDEAFNVEDCVDEALFVHDVYEVQIPPYEAPGLVMGDVGKLSGTQMHQPVSDRLGKPDFEEEDTRNKDDEEIESPSHATVLAQEAGESGTETQWEDLQGRVRYKDLCISDLLRRTNSRTLVEEEVGQLTHRLKALEADRHIMKQTIDSLRRENGEMKLLQEIAQQLRELRGMEQKESRLKYSLPLTLQFQAGPSMSKKRRYNSMPRGSSCRFGTPATTLISQTSSRSLLDSCTEGGNYTFRSVVS